VANRCPQTRFTGCAFSVRSERRRGARRASGKAVWTWPPVVAVDAGAMQIQSWEGAALSRAETVLQGTTHDTVRAEIGYGEKVSQRLWSKKVEEGIGLTARHRHAQRLEVPSVFELERAWKRDLSKRQRHTVLLDSDGNSARQLRIKAYWIFGRNHHRCASIPVVS
jgi:hypothetical protein